MRVLIAEDHGAVRAGLRLLVETAGDLEVVGEAADGAAAVGNARALRPDVTLMDLRMPGMDGVEATAQIVAAGWSRVLVLTSFDLDDLVDAALAAGAHGFLLKTAEAPVILEAIRAVGSGQGALAPEVTARVLTGYSQGLAARGEAAPEMAGLTERERDVLAEIGTGHSNAEIAGRLGISEATAKTHVSRVLAKLGVTSRTQAALLAQTAGRPSPGGGGHNSPG